MRVVSTRVLPLPAPARTDIGPSVASTARRCASFNPSRYFTWALYHFGVLHRRYTNRLTLSEYLLCSQYRPIRKYPRNGLCTRVCRPFLYVQTHPPTTVPYYIQPTISHIRICGFDTHRNHFPKRRERVLAFFYRRRCSSKYDYIKFWNTRSGRRNKFRSRSS